MRKIAIFICAIILLFPTEISTAAEPMVEATTLQDVIRNQTDPAFYEYLQKEIDRSFLPGYQVVNKTILECYYGYDFLAPDKTLEACMQRVGLEPSPRYYIVIDENKCYVLEQPGDYPLQYLYGSYNQWEQLCTMLSETEATTEICGAMRTITNITCFKCPGDGIVVYLQTTEGIFVRHYGRKYNGYPGADDQPYYSVRDYTWEEFIKHTQDLNEWWEAGNGGLMPALSEYIWSLDHPRTSIPSSTPRSASVWIVIAVVVVTVGSAVGVVLYRRKRRCLT